MSLPRLNVRSSFIIVFCMASALWCLMPAEQCFGETGYEAVWFGDPLIMEGQKLSFKLNYPEEALIGEIVPLNLEIMSSIAYEGTIIRMVLLDLEGNTVDESEMTLDLHRGRDDVSIKWDPTNLKPGDYTMAVIVDYASEYAPACSEVPVYRVSTDRWRSRIEDLEARLPAMESGIETLASVSENPEASTATSGTSLQMRARVIREALTEARQALEAKNWRVADSRVTYAAEAYDVLRAGLTFSKATPETLSPHLAYPERLEIRGGGLYDGDTPFFLIGAAVSVDAGGKDVPAVPTVGLESAASLEEQLAWLKEHGLNFALLNFAAGADISVCREKISSLADAAGKLGVPWALQLDQANVAGPVMDTWPELLEPGFVNLAHSEFSQVYLRTVKDLFSVAGTQMCPPVGISIAAAPQFKYDREPIRAQFIARVMEWYPDRQELNRLWHAHLADFNEITIWGEHPEHSYQNQRAYQYEWQHFQRSLITLFFSGLKQELAALAPGVPAMINMAASAFLPGETRTTPGREDMAALMDISGCSAYCAYGDGLYAMNYPAPHALLALMRSYAKNKPVFVLGADIDVDGAPDVERREALVYSAVWEMVMSGASGMALSPDASVHRHPEALAAYALAAMDVNRLAPIVMSFQQAPEEVAVLFSEASKIMDNGVPHLESAQYAFEGSSFAGFPVRFITEKQVEAGVLAEIKVLILPSTMAMPDAAFEQVSKFVEDGGMVARVGTPIPYNENGQSRNDVIRATGNTVLVRGMNLPTEYLHAMDAALVGGVLPEIVRPVNAYGYPLEGVRSRYVTHDGEMYLYIINLRHTPVVVHLSGLAGEGRDLLRGREVSFPRELSPLDPMLIHLDKQETVFTVSE